MTSREWVQGVRAAIQAFRETRRGDLVMSVTYGDGQQDYIEKIDAAGEFVVLSPYPKDRLEGMVEGRDGEKVTPTVLVVPPSFIVRVELLVEAPDIPPERKIGFGLRD